MSVNLRAARDSAEPVGTEPDPRLTFANERTFLAWARTGLALIGGGLAVAQAVHFAHVNGIDRPARRPSRALPGLGRQESLGVV